MNSRNRVLLLLRLKQPQIAKHAVQVKVKRIKLKSIKIILLPLARGGIVADTAKVAANRRTQSSTKGDVRNANKSSSDPFAGGENAIALFTLKTIIS